MVKGCRKSWFFMVFQDIHRMFARVWANSGRASQNCGRSNQSNIDSISRWMLLRKPKILEILIVNVRILHRPWWIMKAMTLRRISFRNLPKTNRFLPCFPVLSVNYGRSQVSNAMLRVVSSQVIGLRAESQCSAQNQRPHCTPPILDWPLAWVESPVSLWKRLPRCSSKRRSRKTLSWNVKKTSNHQPDHHWLYTHIVYTYIHIYIYTYIHIYIHIHRYIYHHISPYCGW